MKPNPLPWRSYDKENFQITIDFYWSGRKQVCAKIHFWNKSFCITSIISEIVLQKDQYEQIFYHELYIYINMHFKFISICLQFIDIWYGMTTQSGLALYQILYISQNIITYFSLYANKLLWKFYFNLYETSRSISISLVWQKTRGAYLKIMMVSSIVIRVDILTVDPDGQCRSLKHGPECYKNIDQ